MNTGAVIASPDTGEWYLLGEELGAGGFGVAFGCTPLDDDRPLCLKLTMAQESWRRETNLAELPRDHAR